ncbi:MAG TPA: hypothetical protein VF899_01870 [Pyrinomonadaceae bacterium]
MKLSTLDIVVLVAYFVAMIRIGFYVTRRVPRLRIVRYSNARRDQQSKNCLIVR